MAYKLTLVKAVFKFASSYMRGKFISYLTYTITANKKKNMGASSSIDVIYIYSGNSAGLQEWECGGGAERTG